MNVVIAGCGGHGREMLTIIRAINHTLPTDAQWRVLGFVDDRPSEANLKRVHELDIPYLGSVDWTRALDRGTYVAVGIGDPRARRVVGKRVQAYGLRAATLIHPTATVADATHEGGLVAFAGARVTTNVSIGKHVHLNQNVTIGHDCILDDYVSVNPLAAVSGDCHLESGAMIGTTAAVLQGIRVGMDATVGAGACVVRDVPPRTVVKGIPAR